MRLVRKVSILGYYYVFFVYVDWNFDGSRFKTYSESIQRVMRVIFLESFNRLRPTTTKNDVVQHPV